MSARSISLKLCFLADMVKRLCSPEDSDYEVANMKPGVGQLEVFPSIWGHWAGGPGDSKEDLKWLDEQLNVFFDKHGTGKLDT